jgi:hypothetical protein
MNDENVNWVAVVSFGGGDETPVIRISETDEKRFGQRKDAKLGVKFELGAASSRRFHHCVNARFIGPGR